MPFVVLTREVMWFTSGLGTVGIVPVVLQDGTRKVYIGCVVATTPRDDAVQISLYGSRFPNRLARLLWPQYRGQYAD